MVLSFVAFDTTQLLISCLIEGSLNAYSRSSSWIVLIDFKRWSLVLTKIFDIKRQKLIFPQRHFSSWNDFFFFLSRRQTGFWCSKIREVCWSCFKFYFAGNYQETIICWTLAQYQRGLLWPGKTLKQSPLSLTNQQKTSLSLCAQLKRYCSRSWVELHRNAVVLLAWQHNGLKNDIK